MSAQGRTRRTWGDGWRCDMCCNGDRCDEPTHVSRERCKDCHGSGIAIWNMYDKEKQNAALYEALEAWVKWRRPSARDWQNGAVQDEFDELQRKAALALLAARPAAEPKGKSNG